MAIAGVALGEVVTLARGAGIALACGLAVASAVSAIVEIDDDGQPSANADVNANAAIDAR